MGDRFIQQAILQVLQAAGDSTFSASSFGFGPHRSAHQAIAQAQRYTRAGYTWGVDLDLEKFLDRVTHDVLMQRIKHRGNDRRGLVLIHRFLKAEVSIEGGVEPRRKGTPQGGSFSPLLATVLVDDLAKELERRGHRFCRYADACNIYVGSQRAGEGGLARVTRFLERRLKLRVNAAKSAVDRPWRRTVLGFHVHGSSTNSAEGQ